MNAKPDMDRTVTKIRGTRGLSVRVAEACGTTRSAVYQWKRVPVEQVHAVAEVLDLTPEQIRPDIFKARRRRSGAIPPKKGRT